MDTPVSFAGPPMGPVRLWFWACVEGPLCAVASVSRLIILNGMFDVIATQLAAAGEKLAYLRRFL